MTATPKTPLTRAAPASSGRPLTLTEVSADLLSNLSQGMTLEEAAKSVGITYRTLRRWVKTGEDELARVEDGKPGLKLKKSLKNYTDFVVQYKQAMVNRRKVLYQASSLVALGGYRLKENHTTRVYKDGQLVNVIEINKEKEVAPDGNLALKLLQYDDTINRPTTPDGDDKPETKEANSFSELFERISKMSEEEMEILANNLEAAL